MHTIFWGMYHFTSATITEYHRLGDLTEIYFLRILESGSLTIVKVSAGLVPPKASLLGLQIATFFLCFYMVFPPNLCSNHFSYMDTRHIGLDHTLMTPF